LDPPLQEITIKGKIKKGTGLLNPSLDELNHRPYGLSIQLTEKLLYPLNLCGKSHEKKPCSGRTAML
jgi:hypothetical protein